MNRKGSIEAYELLIVMVVLAVIAAIAIPAYKQANGLQETEHQFEMQNPLMKPGLFARVKLSGEKVQIRYSNSRWITCLVMVGREYRDGLVSADSFGSEYIERSFKLSELEPWEE